MFTQSKSTANVVDPAAESASFHFAGNSSQLDLFPMESPTPFVMLSGSEHRFTFINQPYVDLIGETSMQEVLMKPVREVLPELEGQPFFQWLDEVYAIWVSNKSAKNNLPTFAGSAPRDLRTGISTSFTIRSGTARGRSTASWVQAADVAEKVQGGAVSEYREETLFRQWAEPDAIYRTAPVRMVLLDAKPCVCFESMKGKQR